MLRIVLIRPGSTDYDAQGRIQGTLDMPLNEHGATEVAQAVSELQSLPLEVIYAPDCQPALQTADAIAEALDVRRKRLDGMQNLNHGLWQGMLVDEVRKKQPKVYRQWQEQPESVRPPEGETLSEAEQRVRNCLIKLIKKHKEGVVALVAPEPLASIVRACLKQEELGDLWKASTEHGRWEVFEVSAERILSLTS